mmetsp:Transcript_72536/g.234727  ORF Transcript_72536/g.234727 Transcript_72536/m.234727 type:complete len:296 (-) Transcript_72536:227-1114(-)
MAVRLLSACKACSSGGSRTAPRTASSPPEPQQSCSVSAAWSLTQRAACAPCAGQSSVAFTDRRAFCPRCTAWMRVAASACVSCRATCGDRSAPCSLWGAASCSSAGSSSTAVSLPVFLLRGASSWASGAPTAPPHGGACGCGGCASAGVASATASARRRPRIWPATSQVTLPSTGVDVATVATRGAGGATSAAAPRGCRPAPPSSRRCSTATGFATTATARFTFSTAEAPRRSRSGNSSTPFSCEPLSSTAPRTTGRRCEHHSSSSPSWCEARSGNCTMPLARKAVPGFAGQEVK